jgi:putative tricarboxylic transport membrane protein
MGLFASVFGDLTSDVVTILLIGPIALIAMQFGPPELAAIILLSLIIITATTGGVLVKGLLMMVLGIFFSMVGQDPLGAMQRFTFDFFAVKSGIPLLPMLIGRTILRSTAIGTGIGVIPGVGQVVAAFVGYAAAKNASKTPEKFGKGELEGVAAAEAANNAVNGPTLVPLLTLGIPGDNVTAILLGAFIAQGLRPGPQLFNEQGPLVFAILVAMVAANVLFLFLGYFAIPLFAKVVTVRRSVLLPLTIVFAFAGSYVFRSNPFDLGILIFFGIFGYVAKKLRFDVTPLVMGFILGPILEYSFGQTISLAQGNLLGYLFLERPITSAILIATPFITVYLWWRAKRLRREHAIEE